MIIYYTCAFRSSILYSLRFRTFECVITGCLQSAMEQHVTARWRDVIDQICDRRAGFAVIWLANLKRLISRTFSTLRTDDRVIVQSPATSQRSQCPKKGMWRMVSPRKDCYVNPKPNPNEPDARATGEGMLHSGGLPAICRYCLRTTGTFYTQRHDHSS